MHREVELLVGRAERDEQVEDLVEHLVGRRVGAVDLVDDDDRLAGRSASALPSTNLVCGIGAFGGVDQQEAPSTIFRTRSTSPPKSAWPGVSMMLILCRPVQSDARCSWPGW